MCSEERHSDAIWMAWMQRVEAKRLASWDTHGMKWERSSGLVCRRAVEPCASCMSWCGAAYRGVAGEAQALQSASAPYGWRRSIGGLFCVLRGRGRRARTYKKFRPCSRPCKSIHRSPRTDRREAIGFPVHYEYYCRSIRPFTTLIPVQRCSLYPCYAFHLTDINTHAKVIIKIPAKNGRFTLQPYTASTPDRYGERVKQETCSHAARRDRQDRADL